MRRIAFGIAAFAAFALAPHAAQAQVQLGPTVAWHEDFDFGIGATLTTQVDQLGEGIGFMGDFLFFFPDTDGIDFFEFNGNLTYDFPLENSTAVPFALAGLSLGRASFDTGLGDGSNTEIGLNLGGGIVFDAGNLRPAVGGRFELGSFNDGFVIFLTLPFELARN